MNFFFGAGGAWNPESSSGDHAPRRLVIKVSGSADRHRYLSTGASGGYSTVLPQSTGIILYRRVARCLAACLLPRLGWSCAGSCATCAGSQLRSLPC